jgi:carboxypeptidase Taq
VGSFGYFPSYGLGAVMAAQMFDAMRASVPDVEAQISRGEFGSVMGWLRENVHRQGARVSAQDLLKNATGRSLSAAAALRYLEGKYLEDEPAMGSAAA